VRVSTLGIIGGTGWLGGALAQAVLETGFLRADSLFLSNRSGRHPLQASGAQLLIDNQAVVDASDTVVISVRPEPFSELTLDASGKRVISLMAGVTSQAIAEAIGATVVVRAMPNAAVAIRQSFTPWHCSSELTPAAVAFVQGMFGCVGMASRVPTEQCIDYLSALSGTGPALPALLMAALMRQAVAAGVPEDIAQDAARGVVVNASQLLATTEPHALLDALKAYKGVTAQALQSLEDAGFERLIGDAVHAGAEVARGGM
jgi:pyrroline-5-carboxylate reductase